MFPQEILLVILINPSSPSDACMNQQTGPWLFQIMTFCHFLLWSKFTFFIQNAFENDVFTMAAILSRPYFSAFKWALLAHWKYENRLRTWSSDKRRCGLITCFYFELVSTPSVVFVWILESVWSEKRVRKYWHGHRYILITGLSTFCSTARLGNIKENKAPHDWPLLMGILRRSMGSLTKSSNSESRVSMTSFEL